MSFIANIKGPLGQKGERRKTRRDYKTKAEREHMDAVAGLRCLVCGAWPVEVHHEGEPRSNMRVLPLCPPHHRREYGPGAYHYSKRAFYELHGSSADLLDRVTKLLDKQQDEAINRWF